MCIETFFFFVILEYMHLLWLTQTAEDSYKLQISIEYMSKMTTKLSYYVLFMFHTASQLFWNLGCNITIWDSGSFASKQQDRQTVNSNKDSDENTVW